MTDFFVAGSWRNRDAILDVLAVLDRARRTSYCFVRETYPAEAATITFAGGADDADPAAEPVRTFFEHDLRGLREASRLLLVLPAGSAGHIEAGIAYGLGKPCYAVGPVEHSEALYRIFDRMFADPEQLSSWLADQDGLRLEDPGMSVE